MEKKEGEVTEAEAYKDVGDSHFFNGIYDIIGRLALYLQERGESQLF